MRSRMLIFLVLAVSLTACSTTHNNTPTPEQKDSHEAQSVRLDGKVIKKATIARVGESLLDIQPIHRTYIQEDTAALQLFSEVIGKAVKLKGVFDLATPDYELVLTFEDKTQAEYSLWLGDTGGTIQNQHDPNTLYEIPRACIEDLNMVMQ